MDSPLKKYGFAAVVAGALSVAAVAVFVKGATDGDSAKAASGNAQASASGRPSGGQSSGAGGGGAPRGDAPLVEAAPATQRAFFDEVQALGTAQARESIVVAAKVTDVIRAIRFDSGDRVAKGQVLVELASVEQQADLDEARAVLASAERDYQRFKDLGDKGFAPKARLDQSLAAYEQAKARVAALESRLADRVIRAPFAGVMGLRTASPGALVRPGDPIGTLDDVSRIKLDFDVPEVHLTRMRQGAPLKAVTAAYPGRAFEGSIAEVDSRIDPATRTVKVRALIDNKTGALKPGMLMTVAVQANSRMALGVPEMAVVERADGASVFKVVQKDGKTVAAPAKVKLGLRSDGYIEVVDGLKEGDQIVVEGVQRARPGQPVRVDKIGPDGAPTKAAAAAATTVAR